MKLYCESCKKKFTIVPEEGQAETACTHCGATVPVPAESVCPGVVLGDFQIKSFIAKGGMGEVYLARQLSLDRDVALKVLQNKHSGACRCKCGREAQCGGQRRRHR